MEFIEKLPQGIHSMAGDAGKMLSGGQRQRISLARAILKDAPIVVLDEATAYADPENEEKMEAAMGKPGATEEEVYAAAKKARCYDFIMALPDGFQTVVGEGGATLSGGEKQRISIARCILKDAPIIILDEATASVDTDNESYIQEAISELVKGKTLLVIAHRLNTIKMPIRFWSLTTARLHSRALTKNF